MTDDGQSIPPADLPPDDAEDDGQRGDPDAPQPKNDPVPETDPEEEPKP